MSSEADPPPGSTSVRMGAAFLRLSTEHKGHYELMRNVITVVNEGDRITKTQHPQPIGPLAVYRVKRRGDIIDRSRFSIVGPPLEMRTMDAKGQPLELMLIWWPQSDTKLEN